MVHQEKRVYQVCGFVFVCVTVSEGVAYVALQVYVKGSHHGRAAVDDSVIMVSRCVGVFICGLYLCISVFTSPQ